MQASLSRFVLGLSLSLLTACGTTSGIKTPESVPLMDLAAFDRVVVSDFGDATKEQSAQSKNSAREFPDLIVEQVRAAGGFASVERGGDPSAPGTLLVTGNVTRYSEGNAAARALIGLGAGSSYFDAAVELRDGKSQAVLGSIEVDKNSWPLGGILAATQTPRTFMEGAAKKVAEELKKHRPAAAAEAAAAADEAKP
jgi:hypothetical protein